MLSQPVSRVFRFSRYPKFLQLRCSWSWELYHEFGDCMIAWPFTRSLGISTEQKRFGARWQVERVQRHASLASCRVPWSSLFYLFLRFSRYRACSFFQMLRFFVRCDHGLSSLAIPPCVGEGTTKADQVRGTCPPPQM